MIRKLILAACVFGLFVPSVEAGPLRRLFGRRCGKHPVRNVVKAVVPGNHGCVGGQCNK